MDIKDVLNIPDILQFEVKANIEINGIQYDSRKVMPGNIFFAVRGYETDGHKYIEQAVNNGAVCIVCEEEPSIKIPFVIVANSRRALALAACNFYEHPSSKMTMIGITGTNGKTSCTYLIKNIIERLSGAKVGLIGTIGNLIGNEPVSSEHTTPESSDLQGLLYKMSEEGCEYLVMEVSSHALALERVLGINFDVGVFTNLSQDHLDFHSDMNEYAEAKTLLFERSKLSIINFDDSYAKLMADHACGKLLSLSLYNDKADFYVKSYGLHPNFVEYKLIHANDFYDIEINIPGVFSVYNSLITFAVGIALGFSGDELADAIKLSDNIKGRAESLETDGDYHIFIDYAHTPDALLNIINALKEGAKGRVVVLFGCGGDRDRKKRPQMGRIASENADFCIVTSDNPRTEKPEDIIADILEGISEENKQKIEVICNREEAIEWAIENHHPEDIIVLAGKGHETYQIVGKVKRHMDEREIVRDIIEKRGLFV